MTAPERPHILIVRFSSLGDIILTTPVYKNLKQSLPGCRITVAVKRKYAGILDGNPHVDAVLPLEEGEGLLSYLSRVRSGNYDILIDLHSNLRSRFLSVLGGIPKVLRYRKAAMERRLFVSRRIRNAALERHTVERYLEPLRQLGIEPKPFPPEIFPGKAPRVKTPRILVIQTAFLGDAVLTTPLFSELRRRFPEAQISLLCTPQIKDIFSGIAEIDELLLMDKKGEDGGFFAPWKWAGKLRGKFDLAIIPHRSFRSAFVAWLAAIPKRIGFANSQGRIFLTDRVAFDWKTHDSERNLKLLEALGIQSAKPEFKIPSADFDFDAFRREHRIAPGMPIVGMNPGSVWNTKRWLPERFAEVADRLAEQWNAKVILFGSKQDQESADAVERAMKKPCLNLCGKTDLKTLSTLVSKCDLFITNDSGPMHIATAAQVPVVAIFGPTTRELGFFPYGPKSVVVETDLECRPCTLHGGRECPLGHFKCMKDVTAEMVIQPANAFLSQRGSALKPA